MAEAMMDPKIWGIPESRCTVVEQPSSVAEFLDPIYQAAEDSADTLLFYYAGHGLTSPHNDDLLFALPNTDVHRPYTSVRFDDVRAAILSAHATPNKLVILDCCFSGRAMAGQMSNAAAIASRSSIEGTYLLTAAAETKTALAPPGEPYTAFTGELIKLLQSGIRQGPELLDLNTVYDHVKTELVSKARPVPQQRNRNDGARVALGRNVEFKSSYPLTTDFDITQARQQIRALHVTESERIQAVNLLMRHAPEYEDECEKALDEILETPGVGGFEAVIALATLARISDQRKPGATQKLIAYADGSIKATPIIIEQACQALKHLGPEYKWDSVNGYRALLAGNEYLGRKILVADEFARVWPEFKDEIKGFLWPIGSDESRNRDDRVDALRLVAKIDPADQEHVDAALRKIFKKED
jgi:hypothetical protein